MEAIVRWLRIGYWPLALGGGSIAFAIFGDLRFVAANWALYWPGLVVGWFLLFQVPSLFRNRDLSVRAGDVWGLVLIVMGGTLWTFVTHLKPEIVPPEVRFGGDLDLFDLIGENYEFHDRFEWTIVDGVPMEIRNSYGSVHVTPSNDGRVRLDVSKSVRASGFEQAAALAPELAFRLEEGDGLYVIRSNQDDMSPELARRFRTRLDVRVPVTTPVTVENVQGIVEIDGFPVPQAINVGDGRALARAVIGPDRQRRWVGAAR